MQHLSPFGIRLSASGLLALCTHVLVLVLAALWPESPPRELDTTRSLSPVSLFQASEQEPEQEPDEAVPDGFFLRLPEPVELSDAPDDSEVVGQFNQAVERQTTAEQSEAEAIATRSTMTAAARASRRGQSVSGRVRPPTETQAERTPIDSPEPGAPIQEAAAGAPFDEPILVPFRNLGREDGAREDGSIGGLDLTRFAQLSTGGAEIAATAVEAPDHLGIEEADRTLLNTRQVSHWSFMSRLVESVEREWSPNDALRSAGMAPDELGSREYLTIVRFSLDANGRLIDADIERASELSSLDREAVRALDTAMPFRNIPAAILEADGIARMTFYFVVDARRGQPRVRWRSGF
ncbi:MAG: TonB family protein [Bradymonadia bacterium]|jgi:TonB family protein